MYLFYYINIFNIKIILKNLFLKIVNGIFNLYVKVGFFEGFLSFFMLVRFFLLVCGGGIFVFGRLRRVFMWCGVGFFFLMFSGFVKKLFCGWK